MDVYGQYLQAYLDGNGSMFDFMANFFIVNPKYSAINAYYIFDKNSTRKQDAQIDQILKLKGAALNKQAQVFEGADDPETNERKPYDYKSLTGKGIGRDVEAQVELYSSNSKSFTIKISLLKQKGNSVFVAYKGDRPSWLPDDGKAIFHGKLMLVDVKDFSAKKRAY